VGNPCHVGSNPTLSASRKMSLLARPLRGLPSRFWAQVGVSCLCPTTAGLAKAGLPHCHYHRIGKANDTMRRGSEIRIRLPERTSLIHSIGADDPSDTKAYGHRRFEASRIQGERFIHAPPRWKHLDVGSELLDMRRICTI
jgi:hypothetical protein